MSASVLGHGHTGHLMETDYLEAMPQVHLHFLTDDEEYKELGYNKVEICCHGCGASILLLHTDTEEQVSRCLALRDAFGNVHKDCPNHKYENWCPDFRTSFQRIDVRPKPRWESQRCLKTQGHQPRILATPTGGVIGKESLRAQEDGGAKVV